MSNSNLTNAKRAKNDEFYTQYNDIEAELTAYYEYNHEVFRNKIVLCPCDDPEWSNFVNFFATNFKKFGLKALISTSYAKSATNKQVTQREKESPYYDPNKHKTHGKLFVMTGDMNGDGHIDSDDVSFQKYLEGDGDFRSKEVTELRDTADIIVTNPPFSLFREFLNWIMEGGKQFIILGNINAVTYKETFPLFKHNKIWLGYSGFNSGMYFYVNDDFEYRDSYHFKKIMDGHKVSRVPGVCWFTNLEHGKRHEKLILDTMANNLRFNKSLRKKLLALGSDCSQYLKYDNYNAIEVPITKSIPSDYNGIMGVPISFLDKFNPDQFEIVGEANTGSNVGWDEKLDLFKPTINGKNVFKRILIRHKQSK